MLITLIILLSAIVLTVPFARKAGLGSVLGYLGAGVVIGPSALGLVRDPAEIAHVSELGVLMLLFLIGLELRPQRIWVMRHAVFGLGLAQVILTTLALAGVFWLAALPLAEALVLGCGFALSSTAIVLPMLAERHLISSHSGRDGFAVLLFQDIATVPLIALIPLLASGGGAGGSGALLISAAKGIAVVLAIILAGRLVVRHVFRLVAKAKVPEVFTATALLVVLAAAGACEAAHLPMSLGAFAAGVLLSDSEYRHELEADVKPFEGLLLGFFFLSIGMQADLALALAHPLEIGLAVAAVLSIKTAILAGLGLLRRMHASEAMRLGIALQQASEFGFVIFGVALAAGVLPPDIAAKATLIAALTMLINPPLFSLAERFLQPRMQPKDDRAEDEIQSEHEAPVVVLGYGRFGQIVVRILRMRGIPVVAVDGNAETVDLARRFNQKAWFGDPTRIDILESLNATKAKMVVVALPNPDDTLRVIQTIRRHYPHLLVLARARDRRHAHQLMDLGVMHIVRETFFSSLRMTEYVLEELGHSESEAARIVGLFKDHDERVIIDQHKIYQDEASLIRFAQQTASELQQILAADAAGQREGT